MNPLATRARGAQINPQMLKGIKSYMQTVKMAQNPSEALSAISQQSPQLRNVMELCKGRNPRDVFMEQCQNMGYDPDEIVKMLM